MCSAARAGAHGAVPVAHGGGRLSLVKLLAGGVQVDVCVAGQYETRIVPSAHRFAPQHGAELGQESAQSTVRRLRARHRPNGIHQRIPARRSLAVGHEVHEQPSALLAGQMILRTFSVPHDDQTAADLDAGGGRRVQGFSKLMPKRREHNRQTPNGGEAMARVINCECGQVIRGDNDEELVSKAQDHVNQNHPELVGKLSEQDLLGMAEED